MPVYRVPVILNEQKAEEIHGYTTWLQLARNGDHLREIQEESQICQFLIRKKLVPFKNSMLSQTVSILIRNLQFVKCHMTRGG